MCFGNTFEVVAMEKKDEILNQVQADQIQVMQEV